MVHCMHSRLKTMFKYATDICMKSQCWGLTEWKMVRETHPTFGGNGNAELSKRGCAG